MPGGESLVVKAFRVWIDMGVGREQPTNKSRIAAVKYHLGHRLRPLSPGKLFPAIAQDRPNADKDQQEVKDREPENVQGSSSHNGNEAAGNSLISPMSYRHC